MCRPVARTTISRATFEVGDARSLPFPDRRFDAVVSGLALNFVPSPDQAVAELARVASPGGVVAAYVWDYADGMVMMRTFWDAAVTLDPGVAYLVETMRFPLCQPEPLRRLWTEAGLTAVVVEPIEVPPSSRTSATSGNVATLTEQRRTELREFLRVRLPAGPIPLTARAWSVGGVA